MDSLQDIADSMNAVLLDRGYSAHPVSEYKIMVGDGMEILAKRALPGGSDCTPDEIQSCVDAMKQEYAGRWKDHSTAYSGIPELLQRCQTLEIRLGVFSNKPEPFTLDMVRHVFPDISFTTIRGAREGVPVKPDPAGALDILREWGCSPQSVLYVGDTNTDMLTGRAAGFHTVGVSWGFRQSAELVAAGAHHVVDSPLELLSFL